MCQRRLKYALVRLAVLVLTSFVPSTCLLSTPLLSGSSLRLFLAVVLPLLFTLVLMPDRCSPFIFLHFNGKNLFAVCRSETFF